MEITIVVRFLNYKYKENILTKYRGKKMWNKGLFVNEDLAEETTNIQKKLFHWAKLYLNMLKVIFLKK